LLVDVLDGVDAGGAGELLGGAVAPIDGDRDRVVVQDVDEAREDRPDVGEAVALPDQDHRRRVVRRQDAGPGRDGRGGAGGGGQGVVLGGQRQRLRAGGGQRDEDVEGAGRVVAAGSQDDRVGQLGEQVAAGEGEPQRRVRRREGREAVAERVERRDGEVELLQ